MLRIGKLCCPLCAGNHKSPIFDNMRAGLSDCRKALRGRRPVGDSRMPVRRKAFTYIPLVHIKPIVCPRCGEKARAVWYSPLPAGLVGEMRTFECEHCGKKTKLIAEETEPQATGAI